MKTASITEAKNNLSALIDGLKGGEPVLILDRGRPVARLEPVEQASISDDDRLSQLIRDGIVRPARAPMPRSIVSEPPPKLHGTASALASLLEERRKGR